jgi:glucokinase
MPDARQFIAAADAQPPFFAGIDLGGTNIKVGVVDDLGRPLSWLTIPTDTERGAEDASRRMAAAVRQAIAEAGLELKQIAYVGLGSPGEMDIPGGMLLNPVNLKGWVNFPIRDRVSHHCGLPVAFENDANAAAYGEYWVGAGRDYESMVLFTLGTGIGCGIIIGDTVVRGAHSLGAECGHVIIDIAPGARVCGCGKRGHLEAYASATAVVRRTREILDAGRMSSLLRRLADGAELTPKLLADEAEAGDALSMEVILETARYMAIGITNITYTIDPDAVFLGGAMTFGGSATELGRKFLGRVREVVKTLAWAAPADHMLIDFATMANDAGFIGAAGIARLEYQKQRRSG